MLLMECRLYVPFLQDVLMGGRKFNLSVLRKNCDRKRHAVQSTMGVARLNYMYTLATCIVVTSKHFACIIMQLIVN